MSIDEVIRQLKTIGECEVGTIRKISISRAIEELEKLRKQ